MLMHKDPEVEAEIARLGTAGEEQRVMKRLVERFAGPSKQ